MATQISVNTITNAAGTGPADFSQGLTLASGQTLSTYLSGSISTTFTFNNSGGTSAAATIRYQRVGDVLTLFFPAITATTGTGSIVFTANTALPSTVRPLTATSYGSGVLIQNNATLQTDTGAAGVNTSGFIVLQRNPAATAWTNAAAGGVNNVCTVSLYVGTGS